MPAEEERIRSPAVAGLFYPADPGELTRAIGRHLRAATAHAAEQAPKAIIAPHAGYVYSGPVAGSAYRAFDDVRDRVGCVVVVGPSHRVPVDGLALSSADAFETPLGLAPVDLVARDELLELEAVETLDAAHDAEHSVEVHIPFVQHVFPHASIVPMTVGRAAPEEVAAVLRRVWNGDETVIVVSSDLSHYHDYETAQRLDRRTARLIEAGDYEALEPAAACGAVAVRGLLCAIAGEDRSVRCLDLRNSGDTAGPRDQVVGYGAFVVA